MTFQFPKGFGQFIDFLIDVNSFLLFVLRTSLWRRAAGEHVIDEVDQIGDVNIFSGVFAGSEIITTVDIGFRPARRLRTAGKHVVSQIGWVCDVDLIVGISVNIPSYSNTTGRHRFDDQTAKVALTAARSRHATDNEPAVVGRYDRAGSFVIKTIVRLRPLLGAILIYF